MPSSPSSPTKQHWAIFALIISIAAALSLRNYNCCQVGVYMDDASYSVLAYSIASTDSYGLINAPGQTLPTRYPFGYPLLLSPIAKAFPASLNPMKWVSLLATLLLALVLFRGWSYLAGNRSYGWGLAVTALVLSSPTVIDHTRIIMSDAAFDLFVVLVLVWVEVCARDQWRTLWRILLLGALATFAVFIRTVGIALFVVVFYRMLVSLGLKRTAKTAALFITGGLVFVLVVLMATPVGIGDLIPAEYANQFSNPTAWGQTKIATPVGQRLLQGLADYATTHVRLSILRLGGGSSEVALGQRLGIGNFPLLLGLAFTGVTLLGLCTLVRGKALSASVVIFIVGYMGIMAMWPWRGVRFLLPILPFLFYAFLDGCRAISFRIGTWLRLRPPHLRLLPQACVALVVLVILVPSLRRGITDNFSTLETTRNFEVGPQWLRQNTSPAAVILAQQPQSVYLYSQRKTMDFPNSQAAFEAALKERTLNYVLVAPELIWRADGELAYDRLTQEIALPILQRYTAQGLLRLVYESPSDRVLIYEVVK